MGRSHSLLKAIQTRGPTRPLHCYQRLWALCFIDYAYNRENGQSEKVTWRTQSIPQTLSTPSLDNVK